MCEVERLTAKYAREVEAAFRELYASVVGLWTDASDYTVEHSRRAGVTWQASRAKYELDAEKGANDAGHDG